MSILSSFLTDFSYSSGCVRVRCRCCLWGNLSGDILHPQRDTNGDGHTKRHRRHAVLDMRHRQISLSNIVKWVSIRNVPKSWPMIDHVRAFLRAAPSIDFRPTSSPDRWQTEFPCCRASTGCVCTGWPTEQNPRVDLLQVLRGRKCFDSRILSNKKVSESEHKMRFLSLATWLALLPLRLGCINGKRTQTDS